MKKRTFLRFPNFIIKAVTLSYDDGVIYDKKLIDILDKYGLKSTFNISSGRYPKEEGGILLTKDQATNLYLNSTHEVAIHGAKHLALAEVPKEAGVKDVLTDRENLENQFGRIIKGMAYANGSVDDDVIEMVKNCGVLYARSCNSTNSFEIPTNWLKWEPTCHHNAKNLNELVDKFLGITEVKNWYWSNSPKLFYLWGHSYEFNDNDNWNVIEDFAKKVGNREDIWYCTNGELFDYVRAFDRLEFSVDGKIIKNDTNVDVYLCYYGKNILVEKCSVKKLV